MRLQRSWKKAFARSKHVAHLSVERLEERIHPFVGGLAVGDVLGAAAPSLVASTNPGLPTTIQVVYGGSHSDPSYSAAIESGTDPNMADPSYLPTGTVLQNFMPFGAGFTGGASVACSDFFGKGYDDIAVAAGPSGGPQVNIYDGQTGNVVQMISLSQLGLLPTNYTGGLNVAANALDLDGQSYLILSTAAGSPLVFIFQASATTQTFSYVTRFNAFSNLPQGYNGGVSIALGGLLNGTLTTQTDSSGNATDSILPTTLNIGPNTSLPGLVANQARAMASQNVYLVCGEGAVPTAGSAPMGQVSVFDLANLAPNTVPTLATSFTVSASVLTNLEGGVNVTAVTEDWQNGQIAVTDAAGDGSGLVAMYGPTVSQNQISGATLLKEVSLSTIGTPGATLNPISLAGGGLIFPTNPDLIARPAGQTEATVFCVEDTAIETGTAGGVSGIVVGGTATDFLPHAYVKGLVTGTNDYEDTFGANATNKIDPQDPYETTDNGVKVPAYVLSGGTEQAAPDALAIEPILQMPMMDPNLSIYELSGFTALNMFPVPARDYQTTTADLPMLSPNTVPTGVTPGTFTVTDATDPRSTLTAANSFDPDPADWIGGTLQGGYGADQTQFVVSSDLQITEATAQTSQSLAERLEGAAEMMLGLQYQHHHAPSLDPPSTSGWVQNIDLLQTPGVDCSNFIAFIYNYALGIKIDTAPSTAALETEASQYYYASGDSGTVDSNPDVPVTITAKPSGGSTDLQNYNTLLSELQPGDMLYIAGTNPGSNPGTSAGHVIMWLGINAPDGNPLIVDCTGGPHLDSVTTSSGLGYINPQSGVEVREFGETGVNDWYWKDMISWSRILPTQTGFTPNPSLPFVTTFSQPSASDHMTAQVSAGIAVPPSSAQYPNTTPSSIVINWGDGSTPLTISSSAVLTYFQAQDTTGFTSYSPQGTPYLQHTYTTPGQFTITVSVTDAEGQTNDATTTFSAVLPGPAPAPNPGPNPGPNPSKSVANIVTGAGPGGEPAVLVYNTSGNLQASTIPLPASFSGGVRVATGDLNGDGVPDIICGAGPGGSPEVVVLDGRTLQVIANFYAFPTSFTGGVWVAAGDLDGTGQDDLIVGAGSGGSPQVNVYSGTTFKLLQSFYAFPTSFTGGVRVAAGDLAGDVQDDIVCAAGPGALPTVAVYHFDQFYLISSFNAYASTFTGGVFVAVADANGDGRPDVITGAGAGGGPQLNVFGGVVPAIGTLNGNGDTPDNYLTPIDQQGLTLEASAFAFPSSFTGGVQVGSLAVGGGQPALVLAAAGTGGSPQVGLFNGQAQALSAFFALPANFSGGVYVS